MTAEAAVVLPLLLLVTLALATVLASVWTQLRCLDAAQAGVRTAARGQDRAAVLSAVHALAPAHTSTQVRANGGLVTVRVAAPVHGPGPLLSALRIVVRATAVGALEPGVGTPERTPGSSVPDPNPSPPVPGGRP